MTNDQRVFDTRVAQSVAHLPDPPAHWSYSTLKEIETCPRRYVLGHASYPNLWSGRGYPHLPHPAALFGDVVHDSLERIVGALVLAGCDSPDSPQAVSVLRDLGGYSAVAGEALKARLAKLEGNPRIDTNRRARLQQQLEDQIPGARTQIQGYLQRITLVPRAGGHSTTRGQSGQTRASQQRRPLEIGSHPEALLRAEALRVKGRVDLLTVASDRVDIVDHKTGAEDLSHLDQLRFYALLWDQDEVANEKRTPLGALTASYPTKEVSIEAPDDDALRSMAEATRSRVEAADGHLLSTEPVAVLGEHCGVCSVRSLCDAYWHSAVPDPDATAVGTWFDYEGVVGQQNGVKSWWMLDMARGTTELLLRTSMPGYKLESGQRLRFLGLRRDEDPDVDVTIATLTANSEVFAVVSDRA